ncbi:hypothetical protein ACIBG8_50280 [Nonomuraea sp. NPDC050556]|uniref:hypothetical protein n=1 Tax=Nonomuraea sp. NPDC050556 TaxID=3364369 RepID=UPI00379848D9
MTTPVYLAIVAFVVYRQMRTRKTDERGLLVLALALIVLGSPSALSSLAFSGVEVVAAVGFGFLRAATVRVWRDPSGVAWSQGTLWTLAAWLSSAAARYALYGVAAQLGVATDPTAFLLFAGVTIGVQSLVVTYRGRTTVSV